MRTTLELPDPLFARLKVRPASERVTLKQLLRSYKVPWPSRRGNPQLLRSADLPQRLCTDAYPAALAMANGWRLVSFDRDFERFPGLQRLLLP